MKPRNLLHQANPPRSTRRWWCAATVALLLAATLPAEAWHFPEFGRSQPVSWDATPDGRVILAAYQTAGFWLSTDFGQTWQELQDRFPMPRPTRALQGVVCDTEGDTLAVAAYGDEVQPWSPDEFPVWYSHDAGQSWERISTDTLEAVEYLNFGNNTHRLIAVSPLDPSLWLLLGSTQLFRSEDGGQSWTGPLDTYMTSTPIQAFFSGQERGRIFLAGRTTSSGAASYDFLRSDSLGHAWSHIQGFHDRSWHEDYRCDRGDGDVLVQLEHRMEWDADPGNDSTMAWTSVDAGSSWSVVHAGGDAAGRLLSSVTITEEPAFTLRALANGGRYPLKSVDGGATWVVDTLGLPENAARIRLNPLTHDTGASFAISGYGTWLRVEEEPGWQPVPLPPLPEYGGRPGRMSFFKGGVSWVDRGERAWWAPGAADWFHEVLLPADRDSVTRPEPVLHADQAFRIQPYCRDTAALRLAVTHTNGGVWSHLPVAEDQPGPDYQLHAAASPDSDLVLLAAHAYGRDPHRQIVSLDSGRTWRDSTWLPDTTALKLLFARSDTLVALDRSSNRLWLSTDLAASWDSLEVPHEMPVGDIANRDRSVLFADEDMLAFTQLSLWTRWGDTGTWSYCSQLPDAVLPFSGPYGVATVFPADEGTTVLIGAPHVERLFTTRSPYVYWEEVALPGAFSRQGEGAWDLAYDHFRNRVWIDNGAGIGYWDLDVAAVGSEEGFVPVSPALLDAWPNPFNASATVRYTLPRPGQVRLELFDLLGRRVAQVKRGYHRAGRHHARLDGAGLASGSYLLRFAAGETETTRRVTLVK